MTDIPAYSTANLRTTDHPFRTTIIFCLLVFDIFVEIFLHSRKVIKSDKLFAFCLQNEPKTQKNIKCFICLNSMKKVISNVSSRQAAPKSIFKISRKLVDLLYCTFLLLVLINNLLSHVLSYDTSLIDIKYNISNN